MRRYAHREIKRPSEDKSISSPCSICRLLRALPLFSDTDLETVITSDDTKQRLNRLQLKAESRHDCSFFKRNAMQASLSTSIVLNQNKTSIGVLHRKSAVMCGALARKLFFFFVIILDLFDKFEK